MLILQKNAIFVKRYFLKLMQGLEQLMDLFLNLFDGRMMSILD